MGTISHFYDGLRNALTATGTRRDPRSAAQYSATTLTRMDIDQAYRGSGIMRKIISIPAMDMVREWRDWKLSDDEITAVEAEEKRHSLRQKIRQAETLRGLGGGALVMGLPGNPSEPAPASVGIGGLVFVNVLSRWHLTFRQIQDDARLPGFGEPAMWQMQSSNGSINIHPSRVIPFRADTTATLAAQSLDTQNAYWGESTVAQVLGAVKDFDAARASFAALIYKASKLRIGIPGLMEMSAMGKTGDSQISARLEVLAMAEGIHNATVYDSGDGDGKGGETITDAAYGFGGARDMLNSYAEFVSAISDIPATRLLGRAPEGMNSSGESQQSDWNKKVRGRQTLELAPCLDRLDKYLVPSALGSAPDATAWYDFAPLDVPSEKENAERFKLQMEASEKLQSMMAIPEVAFNRGLQSLMIDEGYLPELETALAELPDDERYGVMSELEPVEIEPAIDPEPEIDTGGS